MGHDLHANTFHFVWFGRITREDRARRVGTNNFDRRVLLFEIASRTGNGTARTNARNKSRNAACRIAPDLWASSGVVGSGIGRVGVLIGTTRPRYFFRKSVRNRLIMFWRVM